MTKSLESYFSDTDRAAIAEATAQAEQRTSGELVCCVIDRCDDYPEAKFKLALLGAIVSMLLVSTWHQVSGYWGAFEPLWLSTAAILGALVGWLFASIDTLERRAVGKARLNARAAERAELAFLEEEVFNTRARTGLLLFVALFEHTVIVRADEGISQTVEQSEWQAITDRVAEKMRRGQHTLALVNAMTECATLLESRAPQVGVATSDAEPHDHDHDHDSNPNELSNEPRFRKH